MTPVAAVPLATITDDDAVVEPLVAQLSGRYAVDPDDVRRHVQDILAQFVDARLRAFVPVLVEKQLRERLRLEAR
jgi:hypothetical protein